MKENKSRQKLYPISHLPLFCLRASINLTTFAFQLVEKRAAPTSTKETSNHAENTVTVHFEQILKQRKKNFLSVMDVWNRQSENQ